MKSSGLYPSDEEKSNIIQDYQNGMNITQITRKYHRQPDTISRLLKKNGIVVSVCRIMPGDRFGKLTILEKSSVTGPSKWKCLCDCGSIIIASGASIKRPGIRNCGCIRNEKTSKRNFIDKTGQRFGKLLVRKFVGTSDLNTSLWECLCDCGNIKIIGSQCLKPSASSNSCGCSRKGEESCHWNPNLTDQERKLRRETVENYYWRKSVMIRDNYTCQLSGKRNCYLHVHHIDAWHCFPEKRFDEDNGITLHREVHKLFHRIYGRKNANRKDFEEFTARYNSGEFQELINFTNS